MDKVTVQPITDTGTRGFLKWLQRYQPYFYRDVIRKVPQANLAGLGAEAASPASVTGTAPLTTMDKINNLILGLGQAWMTKQQVDAQKDILNMQLDRVKAGLSPLDIDPSKMGLPGANVSVGLAAGTQKMLLYAGLGIAALFLLGRKRARA